MQLIRYTGGAGLVSKRIADRTDILCDARRSKAGHHEAGKAGEVLRLHRRHHDIFGRCFHRLLLLVPCGPMGRPSDRMFLFLLLGPGIFALSTAVIFVKLSEMPPGLLAVARLAGGAALLTPLMIAERRRGPTRSLVELFRPTLVPGLLLGLHFVTWFIGIRMTTAANATLIVNLSPVIMPFALLALVGERVTRREIAGSLLAVMGVAVLAIGSAKFDRQGLIGDAICLGSMTMAVLYLTMARRNGASRHGIGSYLVPLYVVAGIATLAYSLARGEWATLPELGLDWPREIILLALLALLPTAFGHGLLNYAMTRIRGQIVAIGGLGQIPWAALLAVPLLGEYPALSFYPACLFIALGAVVAITKRRPKPTAEVIP